MSERLHLPTTEERTLAALAHGSILLGIMTNGIGGILAAGLIWLARREQSAYVGFQALQAALYQIVLLVVGIVVWGCWFVFYMAGIFATIGLSAPGEPPVPMVLFIFGSMCIPLGIFGLFFLYAVWGALRTAQGYDFRYIVVSDWAERLSDRGPTQEASTS